VNNKTRADLFTIANTRRFGITTEKGPEYTGAGSDYTDDDSDVLANFKNVASRLGTNPITVLGVYLGKHVDSINTFIKEMDKVQSLEEAINLVYQGEGIVSRLDDARNYLDILECLLWEFGLHPTLIEYIDMTDAAGMEPGPEAPDEKGQPEAVIVPITSKTTAPETDEEIEAQLEAELLADSLAPKSPFTGSHGVND
jgi:hypothetical protein